MWLLGFEFRTFRRAFRVLNSWAISPALCNSFNVQDCLAIVDILIFFMWLRIVLSRFVNNFTGLWNSIVLNVCIGFVRMTNFFCIIILVIHEQERSLFILITSISFLKDLRFASLRFFWDWDFSCFFKNTYSTIIYIISSYF